jgi:hypothetical protein
MSHGIQVDLYVNNGGSWFQTDSMNVGTEICRLSDNPPASATKAEKTAKFTAPAKTECFTIVFSITGGNAPGSMVMHYDYAFSESGG